MPFRRRCRVFENLAKGVFMEAQDLDLRRLKAFCLVGQHGTITHAAKLLGLSTPAVSLHLKHLEKELGVTLFNRGANKLWLTEEGRRFMEASQDIIRQVQASLDSLSSNKTGNPRLSISIGNDLSKTYSKKIINFIKTYPDIGIDISIRNSAESIELVDSGDVDLAIGFFGEVPHDVHREKITSRHMNVRRHCVIWHAIHYLCLPRRVG
jgi:DNA-binding transcriptional LysR family regulator